MKGVLIILIALLILIFLWIFFNPPRRFGIHFFGFTVYSSVPIPYFDMSVDANGFFSLREKSHFVSASEIEKLMKDADVLMIGIGYNNAVQVEKNITEAEILNTKEAISRFNKLKKQKKRVAAIIHSTC